MYGETREEVAQNGRHLRKLNGKNGFYKGLRPKEFGFCPKYPILEHFVYHAGFKALA